MLVSFTTINLLRPQNISSLESISTQVIADIRNQQIKAMVGDTEGQGSAQQFGIYFESNGYTLFRGPLYNNLDTSNFKVQLEGDLTLTGISLPFNQVVFEKRSGDVAGFINGSNSFTIDHTSSGISKTLTINQYGAISTN